MKASILKISVCMVALMIGSSSCTDAIAEKEEIRNGAQLKTGGKDLDSPIIVGLASYSGGSAFYPGLIVLYETGITEPQDSTQTDESGGFEFLTSDSGYFYLELYDGMTLIETTGLFEVTDSTYIPITL